MSQFIENPYFTKDTIMKIKRLYICEYTGTHGCDFWNSEKRFHHEL